MIGNIVTSMVANRPTSLQNALGVVVRQKSVIENYMTLVTCSYDKIKRFKASAAQAGARSQEHMDISHNHVGLVQTVADNFDANISSQNGLQSTQSLANLLTQVQHNQTWSSQDNHVANQIKRLKKR